MKIKLLCVAVVALLCSLNTYKSFTGFRKMYTKENVDVSEFSNGSSYAIRLNRASGKIKSKYFAYRNSEGEVAERYFKWKQGKDLILLTSAAYTDYFDHHTPTGITIDNGEIVNQTPNGCEALITVSKNGEVNVADLADSAKVLINDEVGSHIYSLADPFQKTQFMNMAKKVELTAFQTHLLVYKNEIRIDPIKSSANVANRRFLTAIKTGDQLNYIVLGTIEFKTLFEFTKDAIGFIHNYYDAGSEVLFMVNMDTGAQDIFTIYDWDGKVMEITGKSRLDRASNLFTFYQE